MTIENAIKKLEKASGEKVVKTGNRYEAKIGRYIVSFVNNGGTGEATLFGARPATEDAVQYDYCAINFFDNLTQAIKCAKRLGF